MERTNKILITVTVLLWLSAIADIFTTLRYKAFYSLESNPLYFNMPLMLVVKVLIIAYATYVIWQPKYLNKTNFSKFFYLHIIVLLIFGQGFAAYSNSLVHKAVVEKINDKYSTTYTPNTVPAEIVNTEFAVDRATMQKRYLNVVSLILYIPFFLALISFQLYNKMYLGEVKNEKEMFSKNK